MTTAPSTPPLANVSTGISTGDGITSDRAEWKFTKDVAAKFDTHVQKSVPYYAETHQLAVAMSDWFVHDHAKVYDLGCATGHLLVDLRKRHVGKGLQCTGLDSSQPMIDQAQTYLRGYNGITLKCADALKEAFDDDIALFYSLYTLQFVNPQERLGLCRKIHASLALQNHTKFGR
jgi:tRNA (cmo5U34)-methyltransferase